MSHYSPSSIMHAQGRDAERELFQRSESGSLIGGLKNLGLELSSAHATARSAARNAVPFPTRTEDRELPFDEAALRSNEVSELRAALVTASQALHQATRDKKREEAAAAAARAERDEQLRLVAQLRGSLESRETSAEQRVDALQRRLTAVERERDDAMTIVTTASDRIDRMKEDMDQSRQQREALEGQIRATKQREALQRKELDKVRSALRTTRHELRQYETFVSEHLEPFSRASRALMRKDSRSAVLQQQEEASSRGGSDTEPSTTSAKPTAIYSLLQSMTEENAHPLRSSSPKHRRSGSATVREYHHHGDRYGDTDTLVRVANESYERAKQKIMSS